MDHVFVRLAGLAVELNQPLPVIDDWLSAPARFAGDARRSNDERLRRYAREDFPRENRASLEALRARLDSFLFVPQVRSALSDGECMSVGRAVDHGVTIIDLGNPPAGAYRVRTVLAGVLIGGVARA